MGWKDSGSRTASKENLTNSCGGRGDMFQLQCSLHLLAPRLLVLTLCHLREVRPVAYKLQRLFEPPLDFWALWPLVTSLGTCYAVL